MNLHRKSLQILGSVFLVYAFLVASHRGEFWPFSVYPMFSQAGDPWSRALIRDMPADTRKVPPDTVSLRDLPGAPFPLVPRGVNQNDVSDYISKTNVWTEERIRGLRTVFEGGGDLDAPLLILRARGSLRGDSVDVQVTPLLLLTRDSTHLHPSLESPLLRPDEES